MGASRILIIGSQSQIGQVAMAHFSATGRECTGTDRSTLELNQSQASWRVPEGVETAVFCAGMTNIHACEENPEQSERVNVTHTIEVLEKLLDAGVYTVFLSTNLVFDGTSPRSNEDASPNPKTRYAVQKAAVETWIKSNAESHFAVLRLAKVLVGKKTALWDWKQKISRGEEIHPFTDLTFSPVTITPVLEVFDLLLSLKKPGVFQMSGDEEIPYAKSAEQLCLEMKQPLSLVHGIASSETDYARYVPRFSALGMEKLKALGVSQPSSRLELARYIKSILEIQS